MSGQENRVHLNGQLTCKRSDPLRQFRQHGIDSASPGSSRRSRFRDEAKIAGRRFQFPFLARIGQGVAKRVGGGIVVVRENGEFETCRMVPVIGQPLAGESAPRRIAHHGNERMSAGIVGDLHQRHRVDPGIGVAPIRRARWMAMAAVDREEVLKNSELAGIGFGAWREMQQQGQRRRDAGG